MTSGQDVSEYLDILGLVKSYFSSFFGEKKIKKIENFFLYGAPPTPQRMRRFACLQDCLLTLTCHLACSDHDRACDVVRRATNTIKWCARQNNDGGPVATHLTIIPS